MVVFHYQSQTHFCASFSLPSSDVLFSYTDFKVEASDGKNILSGFFFFLISVGQIQDAFDTLLHQRIDLTKIMILFVQPETL